MSLLARAALKATVVLLVCAALMWVPPIRMLVYLFLLMFPLWMLSSAGVPGLGHELNGFFVLSAAAWSLVAMVLWLIAFRIFYMRAKRGG
ncbi:hypothetical protein ACFWZ3_15770 [Frateuria sp. GZRR35]|uniref:hypothetical protein n=1 Tax=Frateuria sp. GZRR35 TaxID=3351536 RepID=UPI003EDB942D